MELFAKTVQKSIQPLTIFAKPHPRCLTWKSLNMSFWSRVELKYKLDCRDENSWRFYLCITFSASCCCIILCMFRFTLKRFLKHTLTYNVLFLNFFFRTRMHVTKIMYGHTQIDRKWCEGNWCKRRAWERPSLIWLALHWPYYRNGKK